MKLPQRQGLSSLFRTYGWLGICRLVIDILMSRLVIGGVRIVRRPFYVRGRRHIDFGRSLTVGVGLRIDAFARSRGTEILIKFGNRIEINDYVHIAAIQGVSIGDDTLIASRVFITDHDHGDLTAADDINAPQSRPAARPLAAKPVRIGARVWIGEGALILPGVTIGDGAIIGGGAVVTRNVAVGCVAVGNPARVIKRYDPATKQWRPV